MNLLQKLIHYIHLKRKGVRNAWVKSSLTNTDYWMITIIICTILILSVLSHANDIDALYVSENENNRAYVQEMSKLRHKNLQQELIILSMLRGSVKMDGQLKTMCIIKASGDCV